MPKGDKKVQESLQKRAESGKKNLKKKGFKLLKMTPNSWNSLKGLKKWYTILKKCQKVPKSC